MNRGRRKQGKYGKRKSVIGPDGRKYDSKRELTRGLELQAMEKAGFVRDLQFQVRYPITIGGVEIRYPGSNRHLTYVADFVYFDVELDCEVIEDTKMQSGFRPPEYKIKRALMHAMGKEITET